MDNKSSFDRSLILPILIGACALAGICLVILALRLNAARPAVQLPDTATPVQYQYLGTEPGIVFPTEVATHTPPLDTDTPPPATEAPTEDIVLPTLTATRRATPTLPIVGSTATFSPTVVTIGATYDDADFRLSYTGNWIPQTGVGNTFKNTLHISSTIGDAVLLSFVGQKLRFVYQAGPSLGVVAIVLDGVSFALDQSAVSTERGEWESPTLNLSSHTLTITHISGGSINVDAVVVVDLSTSTPSPTFTVAP